MHFSLPSLLGLSCLSLLASTGLASSDNTVIIVEVHQLLSNYSHILDDKNFADLSYILTENAKFQLPNNFQYAGRATAQSRFAAEYTGKITLHTVENVFVSDISPAAASVVADGVVTYFGVGNQTGQYFTNYNRLTHAVTKESGSWRIAETTVAAGVS